MSLRWEWNGRKWNRGVGENENEGLDWERVGMECNGNDSMGMQGNENDNY